MKSKKIQILEKLLRLMATVIVKKYKPQIVGISGSVGKTSTKEAVFLVLAAKFMVRKNEKNYNNEIGIPLTIIGAESGGRSILKWLGIFLRWLAYVLLPLQYPEILVLEMGVDRPGDMKYLTSFIPVTVGIITNISTSHIEFFRNIDHIAAEKGKLIEMLPEDGMAILNSDDERVLAMQEKTKAAVSTFGFQAGAQALASDANYNYAEGQIEGISFKLNFDGKVIPVRLNNILARHQIYAALAAAVAGTFFKINLVEVATALERFRSPAGRMNLIAGLKESWIVDDTYNASPISVSAALEILTELKADRKIAVLGDMLELGRETENEHRAIGRKVFASGANLFLAVGERMQAAVMEIKKMGYPAENIFYFTDPVAAGKKLQAIIRPDDLILVKGSQGMRMEKVVKEIVADPLAAEKLLCRQDPKWREKPFVKP